jgi:hypothetical protein
VEELLKIRTVENTVCSWLGIVNDELVLNSRGFGNGGLGLKKRNNPV